MNHKSTLPPPSMWQLKLYHPFKIHSQAPNHTYIKLHPKIWILDRHSAFGQNIEMELAQNLVNVSVIHKEYKTKHGKVHGSSQNSLDLFLSLIQDFLHGSKNATIYHVTAITHV